MDGLPHRWKRRGSWADAVRVGAFLLLVVAASPQALAAQIFVRQGATGANDGSSWANAYASLAGALAVAGAGDDVWVAAGTYRPSAANDRTAVFSVPAGVRVFGGFSGTEAALSQRTPGNPTILSGDIGTLGSTGDNSYHIVAAASGASLERLVLTGGNANAFSAADQRGAALTCINPGAGANIPLTLRDCVFAANTASGGSGGALYVSGVSLTLVNCIFMSDSATSGGGALAAAQGSALSCQDCTFSGNTGGTSGGAVRCDNGTGIALSGCIFWGNTALTANQIFANQCSGTNTMAWCDIEGGWNGSGVSSLAGSAFGDGGGNIAGDPQFAHPTVGEGPDGIWGTADDGLRPQLSSPCIEAGASPARPTDIVGVSRPQGAAADIGAYEAPVTLALAVVNASATDANPGSIVVTRTGPLTGAVSVALAISGTAVDGSDYANVPAVLAMPAGQAASVLTITPRHQSLIEIDRTVVIGIADGVGYVHGAATALVTITDAPPVLSLSGSAPSYTEGASPVTIDGGITVTDADSPDFSGGQALLSIVANARPGDRLDVANNGSGSGQIGASAGVISYGGRAIGTLSAQGAFAIAIDLNGNATPAAVQAMLRAVTFASTSDDPTGATRTAQILVYDGDGRASAAVGKPILVVPVNDAPSVAPLAISTAPNAPVDGQPVASDPDGPSLAFAIGAPPSKGTVAIDAATGRFTYTPALGSLGADTFAIVASDSLASSAPATVTVVISDPDLPRPLVTSDPPFDAVTDVLMRHVIDVDLSRLPVGTDPAYSLVGAVPAGLTLTKVSPVQAILQWTPTAADVGIFRFGVLIDDGASSSAGFESIILVVRLPGDPG